MALLKRRDKMRQYNECPKCASHCVWKPGSCKEMVCEECLFEFDVDKLYKQEEDERMMYVTHRD